MASDQVIREQLHQYFVLEAPEVLSALEQELLDLQQSFSLQKVNNLMRTAHTLEGVAAIVKLDTIRAIAKSLEDIFRSLCHTDHQTINATVEALLFEGVACLRLALNAECTGEPINDSEVLERTTTIAAQIQEQTGHSFNPKTVDALDNQPVQVVTTAQIALEDFRAGQAEILAGDRTVGENLSEMPQQLAGASSYSLEQESKDANLGIEAEQLLKMEDTWGRVNPPFDASVEQPIQIADPSTLSLDQASSKLAPAQKILIIDDSPTIRQMLVLAFEEAGYNVVQAEDGYEAIGQFRQHNDIQLIICDIEMPRMDGLEFLSFRQHEPSLAKIPAIVLTSPDDDTHRSMALQLGATTYITKQTYLKEKVLATARVLLKKKRMSSGSIKWLIPALVLIAGGLTYFFWKNHPTLPLQQTAVVELPRDPNLQIRNSMQEVENIPSGLFSYGGASSFAALTSHGMHDAISAAHPDYRLRYTEPPGGNPGSGTGIDMLINGELSIAQSARPLEDADYNKAKTRGLSLKQVPIAIDGVVYYTHPGLNIPGLSVDQLQQIYRGEVTNWQQVGGANLKITPIGLDPKITSALKLLLGNGDDIGSNVEIVRDFTAAIRKVAETPGGISYASAPIVINQKTIRPIAMAKANSNQYIQPFTSDTQVNETAFKDGTYPMTRRLFIVIRHDGSVDEKAGTAYINLLLSREGQNIIEKAGYVAIH
jgi:ABC-type phosphate transport system substrate-binding protein/DNA-binding response OmpR family regulator/HPt (histidine-containing phosphotransfer) domain-containing protein